MFHSFLFLAFAEVVFNIANYILQIGQARLLGEVDYGRVTLVVGFITMLTILVGRGVPTAMSKRLSEYANDLPMIKAIRAKAAFLQFFIIIVVTSIIFLSSPLLATAFKDATLTPLFRLASFMIPAFALSAFYVQYFNGLKDFTGMGILKIGRGIFRVSFILLGAYFYGIIGAIIGAIIAPLTLSFVGYFIDRIRHHDLHKTRTQTAFPKKHLLNYAGSFMIFLFLYEFFVRTDLYLIKFFTQNDALVGYYNAALSLALIPYYLMFALSLLLFPTISTLSKQQNRQEIRTLLTNVLRFLWIFLLPIAVLFALYAPQIVSLLFGARFLPSAELLPLMLGGTVFGTFFYVLTGVLNGANHTRISATIVAVGIFSSIVLNSYFLPRYGIVATALLFSFTTTLLGVLSLSIIYKLYRVTIALKTFLIVIILASLLIIPARFLPAGTWSFIVSGLFLFGLYTASIFALGLIKKSDFARTKTPA